MLRYKVMENMYGPIADRTDVSLSVLGDDSFLAVLFLAGIEAIVFIVAHMGLWF